VKNSVRYKKKSNRSRAVRRRFVLVVLTALIALALWSLVRDVFGRETVARAQTVAADAASTPAPHPKTTLQPAPWSNAQRSQLARDLDAVFSGALSDRYSLAVIDATGRVIYARRERAAVTPASVQKLIVADTALNVLGPQYRFHTLLAAGGTADSDGALGGDLWLVGSGDPSLRSDDLRAGVAELAREGLKRVDGGVAVDAVEMTGPEINPHWDPDDANEDFQVPTSAISLDDDTAEFRVYGGEPGSAARVAVVPANRELHVHGAVFTSTSTDDVVIAQDSPNVFDLSGYIPEDAEEKFHLPVHDMPAYAGAVLQRMLNDAGVGTSKAPIVGAAPLDTVALWDHRSAPLRTLIGHMLFVSDNHYAEQLMREVGVDAGGRGNDAGGLAAERAFLRSRDIPVDGLHIVDGSGLAENNRVAAITLARILSDAELRDHGAELYALLPAGGRDGTLTHYDFTTALGRVRAKTGHLNDAASLAGYVNTMHHGRVVFAFMINDSPGDPDGAYVNAVDRLASL
jgi:serine-type D-Ala-D-Ala carboxypeptidase/endopeptidase (penicillin-binding protein 4)